MPSQTATIKNTLGLHLRAASKLVKLAQEYDSEIYFLKDNPSNPFLIKLKDIFRHLSLARIWLPITGLQRYSSNDFKNQINNDLNVNGLVKSPILPYSRIPAFAGMTIRILISICWIC